MNLSNEIGQIGEKVVSNWFEEHGVQHMRPLYLGVPRLESEITSKSIQMKKEKRPYIRGILKSEMRFVQTIIRDYKSELKTFLSREQFVAFDKFAHEAAKLPESDRHHGGIDFIAKMPEVALVEVKANDSHVEKRQRDILALAKKHGFGAKVVRVGIEIQITRDVTFEDFIGASD